MCYNCAVCRRTVGPGQAMLRHMILREDDSIERELSVCPTCQRALERESLSDLLLQHRGSTAVETEDGAGIILPPSVKLPPSPSVKPPIPARPQEPAKPRQARKVLFGRQL